MNVSFYRDDEARVCGWNAIRGKRTRIPGTVMALGRGTISHDLAQYVVEAATDYEFGFWGLLAAGATFRSTGRRRTRPGRAVIAAHRGELADSERLAATHLASWEHGVASPVAAALSEAAAQFSALAPGETLDYEWPSPHGRVVRASASCGAR